MRKLEKNNVIFIISKNISHKWAIEINGTNFFTQICMLVRALDGTNFNKLFQMLFIKMLLPFLSLSSRRTFSFLSVNHLNARNSWPNNPRFLLALTHFCWAPQLDTKCKKTKTVIPVYFCCCAVCLFPLLQRHYCVTTKSFCQLRRKRIN